MCVCVCDCVCLIVCVCVLYENDTVAYSQRPPTLFSHRAVTFVPSSALYPYIRPISERHVCISPRVCAVVLSEGRI